jgi:hypothetical protein
VGLNANSRGMAHEAAQRQPACTFRPLERHFVSERGRTNLVTVWPDFLVAGPDQALGAMLGNRLCREVASFERNAALFKPFEQLNAAVGESLDLGSVGRAVVAIRYAASSRALSSNPQARCTAVPPPR